MPPVIGILGGTGAEGSGLGLRFALSGAHVLIGSRDPEKARNTALRLRQIVPSGTFEGAANQDVARQCRMLILTVPLNAQIPTLKSIRESFQPETVLVDATVPLEVSLGGRLSHMVTLWAGSAAEQAARHVPEGVSVVSAFHALSAELLADIHQSVDCDILICGDNAAAKSSVSELAGRIEGARPIDAGPLEQARYAETAGAMLVALNLRHKVKRSGIRITGLNPK
jgi:NADPH-dependent F420 reductase